MEEEIEVTKKDNINKNISLGIVGMVLMKIVSFATIIIVGYIMSASEYGNLSTYNTWVTIFGVFIGFQLSSPIQNAFIEYDNERFHKFCSTITLVVVGSTLLIALPFIFANSFFSDLLKIDPILGYMLIFHCLGSFFVGFMSAYFLAQKQVSKNLIWTLVYSISYALFSLLFAYLFEVKEIGYAIGSLVPNAVMGLFCIFYLLIKSKFAFDYRFLKFAFLFSLPLVMHMFGNVILGQSDKIMIRYILDETRVGEYTMVHNYAMLVNSFWMAINSVFVPYLYENLKKDDKETINKQSKNYLFFFSSIVLGFMLVGREIVRFIISEEYYPGLDVFELTVLAQYLIFIYSFSVNYEMYKKKTVWVAIGTLFAASLNIGLNFWMINMWGIFGAALASAISYLLLVIFHEIISRFIIKGNPVNFKMLLFFTLVSLGITVFSILLKDYWIVRWIVGAAIGVFLIIRMIKVKRII